MSEPGPLVWKCPTRPPVFHTIILLVIQWYKHSLFKSNINNANNMKIIIDCLRYFCHLHITNESIKMREMVKSLKMRVWDWTTLPIVKHQQIIPDTEYLFEHRLLQAGEGVFLHRLAHCQCCQNQDWTTWMPGKLQEEENKTKQPHSLHAEPKSEMPPLLRQR